MLVNIIGVTYPHYSDNVKMSSLEHIFIIKLALVLIENKYVCY